MKYTAAFFVILSACGDTGNSNFPDINYSTPYSFLVPEYYVRVRHANPNQPTVEQVQFWTWQINKFWDTTGLILEECSLEVEKETTAYFIDSDNVQVENFPYSGFSFYETSSIWISNGKTDKVRAVYVHELSHLLMKCYKGKAIDPHQLFEDSGMNSLFWYEAGTSNSNNENTKLPEDY